jgi:hypothetical protein
LHLECLKASNKELINIVHLLLQVGGQAYPAKSKSANVTVRTKHTNMKEWLKKTDQQDE